MTPIPKAAINDKTAIQHFAKSLTFKTISSEIATESYDKNFEQLHAFLRATYPEMFSRLQVTKIGKHGLLMKWQGTDTSLQPVLLMAHQDVVPIAPGTESAWQHKTFGGEIADGYVWGRGALDDKASLMAIFESANTLLKQHYKPKRTIYFFFGDNEENSGHSAVLASEQLKKQGVHFEYVLDEGTVISDGMISHVTDLVAFISVAEKGFLNLQLSATAQGGHSSMPPKVTAIGELSNAIDHVLKKPFPARLDSVTTEMLEVLATRMGFWDRLVVANMWLFKPFILSEFAKSPVTNAMIRTTQAPTIFNAGVKSNVLPSSASAVLNLRLLSGDDVASAVKHVSEAVKGTAVTVAPMDEQNNPSPVSSTTGIGYQQISQILRQMYGQDLLIAPYVLEGATDSRHFVTVADNVYRFIPITLRTEDLIRYHGINERIAIEDYLKLVGFYSAMISTT